MGRMYSLSVGSRIVVLTWLFLAFDLVAMPYLESNRITTYLCPGA